MNHTHAIHTSCPGTQSSQLTPTPPHHRSDARHEMASAGVTVRARLCCRLQRRIPLGHCARFGLAVFLRITSRYEFQVRCNCGMLRTNVSLDTSTLSSKSSLRTTVKPVGMCDPAVISPFALQAELLACGPALGCISLAITSPLAPQTDSWACGPTLDYLGRDSAFASAPVYVARSSPCVCSHRRPLHNCTSPCQHRCACLSRSRTQIYLCGRTKPTCVGDQHRPLVSTCGILSHAAGPACPSFVMPMLMRILTDHAVEDGLRPNTNALCPP